MRRVAHVGVAVMAAAALGGSAASATLRQIRDGLPPQPAPSAFSAKVDNPWFPLLAGSRYVYEGVKDGHPSRELLTVSHQVKMIAGVPCAVVHDRLYVRGRVFERTTDWYSQDRKGNVWYFGEDTAELDRDGHVTSTEGSWTARVDGARPGIYMPARPLVGQSFRQEYYKGQAEDHFKVISLIATVTRPANIKITLLTEEWTPLEPGVIDHKTYVRGIGTVLEQTVRGGTERAELTALTRAR